MNERPPIAPRCPIRDPRRRHSRAPWAARSSRTLRLAGRLLAASALAAAAAGQAPLELPPLPLPGAALDNDAFLEFSPAASQLLARGDALLAAPDADGEAAVEAFELWRQALTTTEPNASVAWWASPEEARGGVPTAVESVETAVQARLEALAPELRARFSARFEPRWETVSDPVAAALEARLSPATRGAARFELRRSDLATALGRPLERATAARRALQHARLAGDAELQAAALRRLDAAAPAVAPQPPLGAPLELQLQLALGPALVPPALVRDSGPAGGVLGGLCALPDGRLVVQGPVGVLVVDPGTGIGRSFDPIELTAGPLGRPSNAVGAGSDPPWILQPRACGDGLLIVEGRPQPYDSLGNVLLRLRPPAPANTAEQVLEALPELQWALRGDLWAPPGAQDGRAHPLLEGLAEAEFQPGPLVAGERVVVQVRRNPGAVESFLLGLDAATGEPLWREPVTTGQDRTPDAGRFARAARGAAPPLFGAEGRVLVTSGLGTVSLHDALDGRLIWAVRHPRRAPGARSFSGLQALRLELGHDTAAPSLAWAAAPPDAESILTLPDHALARPGTHPSAPFAVPQLRVPGADALLGAVRGPGGRTRLLLSRREGSRGGLLAVDLESGAGTPTVRLPPGERWYRGPGGPIHATQRAIYAFDPAAELSLTQSLPWPAARPETARAPSVTRIGDRIVVLGTDQLCIYGPAAD